MKIIKLGINPEPPVYDWMYKPIHCKKCETIFQLEKNDYLWMTLSDRAFTSCPVCAEQIMIVKNSKELI